MSQSPSAPLTLESALRELDRHPQAAEIDLLACDLNGILRGKRIPREALGKIFSDGLKMPRSVLCLDIWGHDAHDNGLVWESGDGDGSCKPCGEGLVPVPWSPRPRLQLLTMMQNLDGTPFSCDPRQALAGIVKRFHALGLTPVVASELEFYLMAGDSAGGGQPRPPAAPKSGYALDAPRVYALDELDEFDVVLTAIRDACAAQNLPSEAISVENGRGQFEVNLLHVADPLIAGDHAVMLRRLVRGVARAHDLHGTFMAKPYGDSAGSGLHVHCSLLDKDGRNVFDDGGDAGTDLLRHAIAGMIETMPEAMLMLAPNLNSYRRLLPGQHAPVAASWAYENRTSALRIPASGPKARRFEHRVAGADANPYLVLAAILAGALHGIETKANPPAPVAGNGYADGAAALPLPTTFETAVEAFEQGKILRKYFGEAFMRAFGAVKRQEMEELRRRVTDVEYQTYLGFL
ncbi:glutamine synthetase [Rhodoblastus acidophilus]|uniref:glutamine synthetase family protein n=1 Tax=Rhodoblastus acidophilus TaxID=1074 RepID=UPI0022250F2C|nr:glutamine synthetase family protein [Rhodoblastus acidophilus]MCW2316700.1 glutamine synthetase [Rhodoblastus acidophilus]